jgi:hypothetical protein
MASHLSLKRIFNHLNRKWFDGAVDADTRVIWAPLNGNNGEFQGGVIRIDTTLQGSPKLVKIVMLHEMIHARFPQATHGRVFHAERDRLYAAGAYKELL